MLAQRYDGKHGHGRIADFVIMNEVNSNDWFDIGCGQGKPCDAKSWLNAISANYNATYDAIKNEQSSAKVMISLTHHFGRVYDRPDSRSPTLSTMTVLESLAARAGERRWQVAYHPYPPIGSRPQFSADDYPKVTYGNIGILLGWLRQRFPNTPSAWEVELTESGLNSLGPHSSEEVQASQLRVSFRNVLGTPGITTYIYHRGIDRQEMTKSGWAPGLHRADGSPKPAWTLWEQANRNDVTPARLSCGFEVLPHITLQRGFSKNRGHFASTRRLPSGVTPEKTWKLLRNPSAKTRELFECKEKSYTFISDSPDCEGRFPMGPVGYAYSTKVKGSSPLYRCYNPATGDRLITSRNDCESYRVKEKLLGYALAP